MSRSIRSDPDPAGGKDWCGFGVPGSRPSKKKGQFLKNFCYSRILLIVRGWGRGEEGAFHRPHPESMTPAVNLQVVSTTPVANTKNNISAYTLKWNYKKKMYLFLNPTPQRCTNKTNETFLIADFFHLSPAPVVHLELRISSSIVY